MRAMKDALSYAALNSRRPKREAMWRACEDEARSMTDATFAAHVDALCGVAEHVREARSGAKGAERIKERVARREASAATRTALDLERLADLEDRMALRRAQTTRRAWFVLGRLLSEAAERDADWKRTMARLIAQGSLTLHERRALGLPASNERSRGKG